MGNIDLRELGKLCGVPMYLDVSDLPTDEEKQRIEITARHLLMQNVGPTTDVDRRLAGFAPRGKHYKHVNSKGVTHYLNMKYVSLRGGELIPVYYFSRDIRKEASPLPPGARVRENPRNGFLSIWAAEGRPDED